MSTYVCQEMTKIEYFEHNGPLQDVFGERKKDAELQIFLFQALRLMRGRILASPPYI